MATTETKILDNIIASRRALLVGGGAAMAALAMPKIATAATVVTSYTDADILNFALQLEYLEANFYYLAAFGANIYTPTAASMALGQPAAAIGITGTGTQGVVVTKATTTKVPFLLPAIASYAAETAIEEGKHVILLRGALGGAASAQPAIDLNTAFNTLANAAGIGPTFDPFASDANFLIGAYVFEDVGVTAYHGAAPLLQQTAAGKSNLATAAGILAVEAYHAGLIRTSLNAIDTNGTLIGYTQKISALRTSLAKAVAPTTNPYGPYESYPDDIPLSTTSYSLAGGAAQPATTITDADQSNVIAFTRTTTQVLNIVTGGGAAGTTKSTGVFFPAGLNGLFT